MSEKSKCNEISWCAKEYREEIIEMLENIESIERLIKIRAVVETHLKLHKGEI